MGAITIQWATEPINLGAGTVLGDGTPAQKADVATGQRRRVAELEEGGG